MRGRDFTVSAMVSKKKILITVDICGQYYQALILFLLNIMHWTWPNIELIDCKVILLVSNTWSEQILINKK
jgi:hypothetical protein